MSLADTAELWAFGKRHQQHEFWRFMHQPPGQYISSVGVPGVLAIARSDIDWAFMENDCIDIYTSRGAWYSERFGYLDVIEMCAAGLDYEYVDVLTQAGILPEKCAVLHRAGVPADYAAAAKKLLTENIIEAWDSGLPLEYISAAVA